MPSNRPALCGCGGAAVATAQGCIASWPGTLPAGSVCDATVLTMDLLPTFARLAGATTPAAHAIDGIDVMPILRVDAATSARILHWRYADGWAVREGPWKLLGEHDAPTMLVNLIDDLGL